MNILILSAAASAMNYIYSLRGRSDLRLFATDPSNLAGGLYEWGVTPLSIPRARDHEVYRAALERILVEHRIDVLIPTSDYDVESVMFFLAEGWRPQVKMFRPDPAIYRVLSDKQALVRRMSELGFPAPRLYPDRDQVVFPAVAKPARESGGKGVAVVRNSAELDAHIKRYAGRFGEELVFQEYIPGEVGSTHLALLLYGADGELYGEVTTHSHLTEMTWGCGGYAGAMAGQAGLLEQAKSMMKAVGGWAGPINLEFRRHSENGQFYVMEANCRLNGYSYHSTMNGLNFPAAIIDLLTTGTTAPLRERDIAIKRNFVLGNRERVVERFVECP